MIDTNNVEAIQSMDENVLRNRLQYSIIIRKIIKEKMKDELGIDGWETLYQVKE